MQIGKKMEDLIKAHGWEMKEQNFLQIKDSKYQLSVIPEYSYFVRDEKGMIHRSKEPQYLVLNCAIMSPITLDNGDTEYKPVMYVNITSEEEFYDFMIEINKTVSEEEKPNLEKAI
jgi:hypothetical protein